MTALGASSKTASRGPIPSPSLGLEMIQFPLSKILCHRETDYPYGYEVIRNLIIKTQSVTEEFHSLCHLMRLSDR